MNRIQSTIASAAANLVAAIFAMACITPAKADFVVELSLTLQSQTASEAVFNIDVTFVVTPPSSPVGTFVQDIRLSIANSATALQQPQPNPTPFDRFNYVPSSNWAPLGFDTVSGQWAISFVNDSLQPNTSESLGQLTVDLNGIAAGSYAVSLYEAGYTDARGDFGNGTQDLVFENVGSLTGGSTTLIVAATPEPSSFLLLTCSAVAIRILTLRRRQA